MDLQVIWPSSGQGQAPGAPGTIWPAIEDRVLDLVENHRSTIVFANSRRTVEKLTAKLNDLAGQNIESEAPGQLDSAPAPFRASRQSESRRAQVHRGDAQERGS